VDLVQTHILVGSRERAFLRRMNSAVLDDSKSEHVQEGAEDDEEREVEDLRNRGDDVGPSRTDGSSGKLDILLAIIASGRRQERVVRLPGWTTERGEKSFRELYQPRQRHG